MKTLDAIITLSLFQKWQLGTVFIPDSLGYLIGTNFFGALSYTMGQWRMAVLATLLVGISAIMVSCPSLLIQRFTIITPADSVLVKWVPTLVY